MKVICVKELCVKDLCARVDEGACKKVVCENVCEGKNFAFSQWKSRV